MSKKGISCGAYLSAVPVTQAPSPGRHHVLPLEHVFSPGMHLISSVMLGQQVSVLSGKTTLKECI